MFYQYLYFVFADESLVCPLIVVYLEKNVFPGKSTCKYYSVAQIHYFLKLFLHA